MSLFWLNALLLVALLAVPALAEQTPIQETRSTLEKWVENRELISKARSDWGADKETIAQTLSLYERELKGIEDQLSKVSTNSAQVDKERAEATAQKTASEEVLNEVRHFAEGFEGQLKTQVPQLPAPLQEILKPLLRRLPTDAATKMGAAERMQVIVGVLNELDKFNNSISLFSEKQKNQKGEAVAVDTLYVGLGAAYFANETGDFAGTGTFANGGWDWNSKPELAPFIREAIQIYRNERPAKFVALPAVIR